MYTQKMQIAPNAMTKALAELKKIRMRKLREELDDAIRQRDAERIESIRQEIEEAR